MLNHLDQAKAKHKRTISQPGTGNIIRRRKGEKDKYLSICIEPRLCAAAAGDGAWKTIEKRKNKSVRFS
jgi:hypothetical protein